MHIKYTPKTPEEEKEVRADCILGSQIECELQQTDYIIIKIAEAEALGDHAEAERIRKEHSDTIKQRAEYRKQINEIKAKWEK